MITDIAKNETGQSEFVYYFGIDEQIILKETMIQSLSVAIIGLRQKIRKIERKNKLTNDDHRDLCKYKISKTTLSIMLEQFKKSGN